MVSNAGLKADQMIRVSRMRDRGEKAFRRFNCHFGLRKTYVHHATTSQTTATTIKELYKYQKYQKHDKTWMPIYAMTKKHKMLCKGLQSSEQV